MSDKKNTKTVAVYQTEYNNETLNEVVDWIERSERYIRITEPQEVMFIPLDHGVVLKARLDALDREIRSVRAIAQAKVDDLKDQRQRLLAITHDEAS